MRLDVFIRQRRNELGISQSEAARRMGVTRQRWKQIEEGGARNPTIRTLRRVAEVLEIGRHELLESWDTLQAAHPRCWDADGEDPLLGSAMDGESEPPSDPGLDDQGLPRMPA